MIDIVFVRYYLTENEIESKLSFLIKTFKDRLGKILIINIGEDDFSLNQMNVCIEVVKFDGDMMDISAYKKGLSLLCDSYSNMYLLLNDTLFFKHPGKYLLKQLEKTKWAEKLDIPFAIGVVDETKSISARDDSLVSGRFISTFAFIINKKAIEIFNESYNLSRKSLPDPVFSSFLNLHLYNTSSPYIWNNNVNNKEILEKKKSCVYFERLFSYKIKNKNGIIIDANLTIVNKVLYRLQDKIIKWLK